MGEIAKGIETELRKETIHYGVGENIFFADLQKAIQELNYSYQINYYLPLIEVNEGV